MNTAVELQSREEIAEQILALLEYTSPEDNKWIVGHVKYAKDIKLGTPITIDAVKRAEEGIKNRLTKEELRELLDKKIIN